ncbi:MAG TPA: hypothetical protein VGI92_09980 [Gemmatimonadales bacterium]|jgi:hypothetical protein
MRARSLTTLMIFAASLAVAARAEAQGAFTGLYVAGPGDIWAAGPNGGLFHGGSGSWIRVPTSTSDNLNAIAGSGPRDIWAGGDHAILYHWTGASLTAMRAPVHGNIVALSVCSPSDAWAVVQSDNDQMPPALLHWNGSAWSSQRMGFAFRVAGVSGSCPNLVMVGTTFFDPKPTEVHQVGVLARLQGGSWTTSGWNGHSIDDQDIGGTGWTGINSGSDGTLLLRGGPNNSTLLMGHPGSWSRLSPVGDYETAVMTSGGPVLIRKDGFSRWTGGSWQDVGQAQMQAPAAMAGMGMGGVTMGRPDTAKLRSLAKQADSIQRSVPRGEQPNGQQMQALMAISAQMMQAQGITQPGAMNPQQAQQMAQAAQQQRAQMQQMTAQGARNQTLNFMEHPVVYVAGADFYVATQGGGIMHVTGDSSHLIFDQMCLQAAAVQYDNHCKAEAGVTSGPQLIAAPAPAAPGAEPGEEAVPAQQPSRGINLPRPRIRLPGRP